MQRKITPLGGEKKVVLRQTPRAVTPFGGLSVFIVLLAGDRLPAAGECAHAGAWQSPNAIDPGRLSRRF